MPVEVTDVAPVPPLSAKIPIWPPVLLLAVTVRLVPLLNKFKASIPMLVVPVAVPVEVTDVVPVP